MKSITDKSRLYTSIAMVAAFLQTLVATMKFDEITTGVVSTVLLTIAAVFTLKKQRVSVEINKKAIIATWVLVGIAALGGINEILDQIVITGVWQDRLRTIIAALIGVLNIASKSWFPTEEGKIIQDVKKDLKEGTFGVENTVDIPIRKFNH